MALRIPKVVVVGPCYVDIAIKCKSFPGPGQTVEGSGFSCIAAGSGTNRAIEAALCGCDSYLVGKVGDDSCGKLVREKLHALGVNVDYISEAAAISTGTSVTMVDSMGENSTCISEGANRALSIGEMSAASIEQLTGSADVCLVCGDLEQEAVAAAVRTAKLGGTKVILESPLRIGSDGEMEVPTEFYSVDVLIVDVDSSDLGSRSSSFHELKFIGSDLVAKGVDCVVIRMNTRGGLVVNRQGSYHIEGIEIDVVDHSGCEDAFAGAFAASYGAGDDLKDAMKFAVAAGTLACGKFGTLEALPRKEEIIELLQKLPD